MMTPAMIETAASVANPASPARKYSAAATSAEAPPPKPLNTATIWGMEVILTVRAMMSPIAINRADGVGALRQMLEQGRQRLRAGWWVIMFPEGTRIRAGERGQYHVGGAWLASRVKTAVVPVAHNAGTLWGRDAFMKYPGTITVSVGPPIEPDGLKPEQINKRVETWIEQEVARLGSARSS